MKKFIVLICGLLLLTSYSCKSGNNVKNTKKENTAVAKESANSDLSGIVLSTMDASRYTYIEYKTPEGKTLWAAVLQTKLNKGDKIRLINARLMRNFKSETLGKTFDLIYFAEGVEVNGEKNASNPHKMAMKMPEDGFHSGKNPHISQDIADIDTSKIEKLKDGVSIKELIEKPENFKGKTVKLRGVVVKFLPAIMGKNWIHLKDASTDKDITATTKEKFKVGDVVEIEGKVETKKDFGFGYYYDILIEDAKKIGK